eukprot:g3018.t1
MSNQAPAVCELETTKTNAEGAREKLGKPSAAPRRTQKETGEECRPPAAYQPGELLCLDFSARYVHELKDQGRA